MHTPQPVESGCGEVSLFQRYTVHVKPNPEFRTHPGTQVKTVDGASGTEARLMNPKFRVHPHLSQLRGHWRHFTFFQPWCLVWKAGIDHSSDPSGRRASGWGWGWGGVQSGSACGVRGPGKPRKLTFLVMMVEKGKGLWGGPGPLSSFNAAV